MSLTVFSDFLKHHKPHKFIALVTLLVMILSQPELSSSTKCAPYSVKKIKIYSEFSKGYVRIENRAVVASPSSDNENTHLYKITINGHHMLLYHISRKKFICWNRSYTKLVARKNPTNLTHCKFEEKVSLLQSSNGAKVRLVTVVNGGIHKEMRFDKSGHNSRRKRIDNCLKRAHLNENDIRNIKNLTDNVAHLESHRSYTLMKDYKRLLKCENPDFLIDDKFNGECAPSGISTFCTDMKNLKRLGHNITPELQDLCSKEWSKN